MEIMNNGRQSQDMNWGLKESERKTKSEKLKVSIHCSSLQQLGHGLLDTTSNPQITKTQEFDLFGVL